MQQNDGMTLIVKTVTRISVWMILLYGIYIIFHGHLSPGGGFAGGVIIALAFLNVMLAYGRKFTSDWLIISFLSRCGGRECNFIFNNWYSWYFYRWIPTHLKLLEDWMKGYKPEELFDADGRLVPELRALAPTGTRRM